MVAWQPGIQAGNAISDLLFGDASPSGRLTMSFPIQIGPLPVSYNRYRTGRPSEAAAKYSDLSRAPLFPFGFGLTYASFGYEQVRITAGKPAVASAVVTNMGEREGEEVVQLYVSDLACSEGARPQQELRGFKRLRLQPGESREVHFALTDEVLGFTGRDGKWRVEPGRFQIWIAPHAKREPRQITICEKPRENTGLPFCRSEGSRRESLAPRRTSHPGSGASRRATAKGQGRLRAFVLVHPVDMQAVPAAA